MNLMCYLFRTFRLLFSCSLLAGALSGLIGIGLVGLIPLSLNSSNMPMFMHNWLAWTFFGLCALQFLGRVATNLLLAHLGQATVFRLRMQLSRQILRVPLRRLQEIGVPRLLALLTDDIASITGACELLPLLLINFAIVASCLAYLGWLSWQVFALIGGMICFGILTFRIARRKGLHNLQLAREQNDVLFTHLRGLTEGIKELKLGGSKQGSFVSENLEPTAAAYRRHYVAGMGGYVLASNWGNGLFYVAMGLVLFVLPQWQPLSLEILTGCVLAVIYMMAPLSVIMTNLPILARGGIALNKIEGFGRELSIHGSNEELETACAKPTSSQLELNGVVHRYRRENDDRSFILGPLDLTLLPGELVFLIGGNGSGKTTLALLLVGLYVPEDGEIVLDGHHISDANREYYRQHFSAVFSDFYLFESLLGFENRELDDKARDYLRQLQLDHKVKIEDGRFSTVDLSQGQRKRLALLVTYLEDRPFYVFDEWAADQDPVFKRIFYMEILPSLKARGKTVVVITHDDGYFHVADRCLRLEDGKITEILLSKGKSNADDEALPRGMKEACEQMTEQYAGAR